MLRFLLCCWARPGYLGAATFEEVWMAEANRLRPSLNMIVKGVYVFVSRRTGGGFRRSEEEGKYVKRACQLND